MNGTELASYLQAARSGLGLLRSLVSKKREGRPEPPSPPNLSEEFHQLREELLASESNETSTTIPQLKQETVATACVPCALGHFSTSAGLLNEAVRFKAEGIASNEVIDRIAKSLQEQNTLERVDLTPEKIRSAPDWERNLAEKALEQSRGLRHRLETIKTIEDLEQAAADTEGYYRSLNREWWKHRLAKLDKVAEPKITLEEAKALAAKEAASEVERQWRT
ncbi:hypothetical protein ES703_81161 [subsurface metagenome]